MSRYLLTGMIPRNLKKISGRFADPNFDVTEIAIGDRDGIIRAACEAKCGVMLFDLSGIPDVSSIVDAPKD